MVKARRDESLYDVFLGLESVWPDAGIDSGPNLPTTCPNVA